MEILRRVLLVAGVLTGVWFYMVPTHTTVTVYYVDFAARQAALPRSQRESRLPLQEFIAREMRHEPIRVRRAEWGTILDVAAGRMPVPEELQGRCLVYDDGRCVPYLRPDDPRVRDMVDRTHPRGGGAYVAVEEGGNVEYLSVHVDHPSVFWSSGLVDVESPMRRYAPWCALAGMAAYILLPWSRREARTFTYHRLRSVWIPDAIGLAIATGLFVLSFFITGIMEAIGGREMTGANLALGNLIPQWVLCLFGLAIMGAAAWRARFRLVILPEGVRRETLWGSRTYRFDAIDLVVQPELRPQDTAGGWWGTLLRLWHRPTAMVYLPGNSNGVVELPCPDGRGLRLIAAHLRDVDGLVGALDTAGVAVDAVSIARAND